MKNFILEIYLFTNIFLIGSKFIAVNKYYVDLVVKLGTDNK